MNLLDAGSNLNIKNKAGHTALMELLWVNPNTKGESITGKPFNHELVYQANLQDLKDIIRKILARNIDIELQDNNGFTAIDHAERNNHDQEIIDLLKLYKPKNVKNKSRCILS